MERIADKMRIENAENFDKIKKELTEKIVNDIRNFGDAGIYLSTSIPLGKVGDRKGSFEGWEINKDFRIAAKEYYLQQGFVVIDCVSSAGNLLGYKIQL